MFIVKGQNFKTKACNIRVELPIQKYWQVKAILENQKGKSSSLKAITKGNPTTSI
jgi:hypothetical protein